MFKNQKMKTKLAIIIMLVSYACVAFLYFSVKSGMSKLMKESALENMLADLIESTGADIRYFDFNESELYGCTIHVKNSNELLFNLRDTIQDAEFCDIYYRPTNKQSCKHQVAILSNILLYS